MCPSGVHPQRLKNLQAWNQLGEAGLCRSPAAQGGEQGAIGRDGCKVAREELLWGCEHGIVIAKQDSCRFASTELSICTGCSLHPINWPSNSGAGHPGGCMSCPSPGEPTTAPFLQSQPLFLARETACSSWSTLSHYRWWAENLDSKHASNSSPVLPALLLWSNFPFHGFILLEME